MHSRVNLATTIVRPSAVAMAMIWSAVGSASIAQTKSGLVATYVNQFGVNSSEVRAFRHGLRSRQFDTSARFWRGLRDKCHDQDALKHLALDAMQFPRSRIAQYIPSIPGPELEVQGEIILGRSSAVAPLGIARDISASSATPSDDYLQVLPRMAALQDQQWFFLWQVAEFNRYMMAGVYSSIRGRYVDIASSEPSDRFREAIVEQLVADDAYRDILLWGSSATFLAIAGPYQDPQSKAARWWVLGRYWADHPFTPTPKELTLFFRDLEPLTTGIGQMATLMSKNVLHGIVDSLMGSVLGCRIPPESQSNELLELFMKQWAPLLEPRRIHLRPWALELVDLLLDRLDDESAPDLYLREWIDGHLRYIETHPETQPSIAAKLNNAIYQDPERYRSGSQCTANAAGC